MSIFIIAGNHQQADDWLRNPAANTALTHHSLYGQEVRYVSRVEQLRGASCAALVFTGTWNQRKDVQQIHDEVVFMIKLGKGYIIHGS